MSALLALWFKGWLRFLLCLRLFLCLLLLLRLGLSLGLDGLLSLNESTCSLLCLGIYSDLLLCFHLCFCLSLHLSFLFLLLFLLLLSLSLHRRFDLCLYRCLRIGFFLNFGLLSGLLFWISGRLWFGLGVGFGVDVGRSGFFLLLGLVYLNCLFLVGLFSLGFLLLLLTLSLLIGLVLIVHQLRLSLKCRLYSTHLLQSLGLRLLNCTVRSVDSYWDQPEGHV